MIGAWTLSELAAPLAARDCRGEAVFTRVSTDSRSLQAGDLFVALSGPNFDGNRFVAQAQAAGAVAAVVSELQPVDLPQLLVSDTRAALGLLGGFNRARFTAPLVAVTGSSGKTSVKEMLAEILRSRGPVQATRGNLNNAIGVPLTLLALAAEHRFGVIELGASGPDEIAYTVGLTRPQVAILTNAGGAHLEGFGSLAGVVRAKGEIFTGLADDGVAVINGDDPHAEVWLAQRQGKRSLTFSLTAAQADLFASDLACAADGCYRFVLHCQGERVAVTLRVIGRHAVANGLAAAAAAHALGLSLAEIAAGLVRFSGVPGRLRVRPGRHGARLIDDSYNANPDSVNAAIQVLAELPGRRVLVLGNMAELGADSAALHTQLGEQARRAGIDQLVAVGSLAALAAPAFGEGASCFDDCEAAATWLLQGLTEEMVVLVKGSRSSHMEDVVMALIAEETA